MNKILQLARQEFKKDVTIAKLLGVTDRQVRNWKTGKTPLPYMAEELLRRLIIENKIKA